ncbi:hypothetical protein [Massilia sp. S19_KUP03_FR1]|uniref:hypothetical protein n=1 Tax=Massilia sp. S19_KUP03_FR1 TaxID=3025503 RepID=UPI002FCD8072
MGSDTEIDQAVQSNYVLIRQLFFDKFTILQSALTSLVRFVFRTLLSLLAIAVVLVGGRFLLDEGRVLRSSSGDLQTLSTATASLAKYRENTTALLQAKMVQAQKYSIPEIDKLIADATLRQQGTETEVARSTLLILGPAEALEKMQAHYKNRLAVKFATLELEYLQKFRAYLIAVSGRENAYRERRKLAIKSNQALEVLLLLQNNRDKIAPEFAREFILIAPMFGEKLERVQRQVTQAKKNYDSALANYEIQKRAVDHFSALPQRPTFAVDQQALDAVTKDMADRLAQARTAVSTNWVARYVSPVIHVLPLALAVLLSSIVAHLFIKLLFYFVLAPLAARRKPIQLEAAPAVQSVQASASAVSQNIHLEPGEELLILPGYLQSVSTGARKDTKPVLDWSCLWTSIISGMVMLTRLRTSSRVDPVVVSSDVDAVSELTLVTIPLGAAMVFQPHGLVGVIYPSATPLKITRRWRLFSAHAWLTLQLRYLIFRGPVTLIVKGTRGVRVEPAGQGRVISQFATLGFSSHLHYATVRSETFWPYYQNKTPLLQDKFDGANGYYVYDETPRFGKTGGFFSRGLEGLTDAVMKVFGI